MILTLDLTSIDIGYAQYPLKPNTMLVQATERSGTGIPYTEDFSVQIGTTTYNFQDMHRSQYVDLLGFFVNDAIGRLNQFTITDDRGNDTVVKFVESSLSFDETYLDYFSGSFTVEQVA